MTRFQNFEEIFSALFVDFDNIYTRLSEQDPSLARTFATNPQRWMRWLDGHALRMMYGDGVRRRILKRCCYLNPARYHEFRPFFIRSAFHVVDCPPLTNYGKTSADIHLVMDCMDVLTHVTRFDEIIILSGDADFTPLLLRIQEHARRSLVLSVGYTSPAYAAACSWRIREDWFLAQALEEPRDEDKDDRTVDVTTVRHQDLGNDERPPYRASNERDHQEAPARQEKSINIALPAFKRIRLVEAIKQLVAESSVPVPLPSVAQVLQSEQEATADWFGAGTLRDLLEVLDIAPIFFSPVDQGFIFDPERHGRPENEVPRDEFKLRHPALYEFALKIHRLTELPLLSSSQYALFFDLLTDEVNANGFSRTGTVRNVEDRCEDEGLSINTAQIAFIVEAIIRGGVNFASSEKNGKKIDIPQLRKAFFKSADDLCELVRVPLNDDEKALMREWLYAGSH